MAHSSTRSESAAAAELKALGSRLSAGCRDARTQRSYLHWARVAGKKDHEVAATLVQLGVSRARLIPEAAGALKAARAA